MPTKRRASEPVSASPPIETPPTTSAATVPVTGAATPVASTLPSAASCLNPERPKPAASRGHHTIVEPSVLQVSGGVSIETISELRTFAVSSYQNGQEIVSIAAAGRLSNWLRAIGEPERAKLIQTLDLPGTKPLTEVATILARLQVTNDAKRRTPHATPAATPVGTTSALQIATDTSAPSPTPRPKPRVPGRPHTVSRPRELHPQPLSERCVNLSAHTAPIKQTFLAHLAANARIDLAAFPRFFRGTSKPVSCALRTVCISSSPRQPTSC